MLLLLLLASAFLLLPGAGAGRIIGGRESQPHSRPYMAYLTIKNATNTSHCGGFLIRPDAVVSAAHCVTGKGKVRVTVILGAHNVKKIEPSQQKFHVHHFVIHPKYSKRPITNDIVLLKLDQKAQLTNSVSYINLPNKVDVKPGITCTVAGWGQTSLTGKRSSVLREVDLKVQDEKVCENNLRNYVKDSMICIGDEHLRKSTFHGDSGGPLVCNRRAHGIVSYGRKNFTFPKVFTRISYFKPWIRVQLRKFSSQDLPDSPSSD